jgi:hypothetical protein
VPVRFQRLVVEEGNGARTTGSVLVWGVRHGLEVRSGFGRRSNARWEKSEEESGEGKCQGSF